MFGGVKMSRSVTPLAAKVVSFPRRHENQYWRRDAVVDDVVLTGTSASTDYLGLGDAPIAVATPQSHASHPSYESHSVGNLKAFGGGRRQEVARAHSRLLLPTSNVSTSSSIHVDPSAEAEIYQQLSMHADYANMYLLDQGQHVQSFTIDAVPELVAQPLGMLVSPVYSYSLSQPQLLPANWEGPFAPPVWNDLAGVSFLGGGTQHQQVVPLYQPSKPVDDIAAKVSNRLLELREQRSNEEPEGPGVSENSAECMMKMLSSVKGLRMPALSITPDGNVYASWRNASGAVFSVHFLENGETRYVILRRDDNSPGVWIRSTGSAPANRVLTIPETSSAKWIFE